MFEFRETEGKPLKLEDAIWQAIGAASTCWEEMPLGYFDGKKAKQIGDKLLEFIRKQEGTL